MRGNNSRNCWPKAKCLRSLLRYLFHPASKHLYWGTRDIFQVLSNLNSIWCPLLLILQKKVHNHYLFRFFTPLTLILSLSSDIFSMLKGFGQLILVKEHHSHISLCATTATHPSFLMFIWGRKNNPTSPHTLESWSCRPLWTQPLLHRQVSETESLVKTQSSPATLTNPELTFEYFLTAVILCGFLIT